MSSLRLRTLRAVANAPRPQVSSGIISSEGYRILPMISSTSYLSAPDSASTRAMFSAGLVAESGRSERDVLLAPMKPSKDVAECTHDIALPHHWILDALVSVFTGPR